MISGPAWARPQAARSPARMAARIGSAVTGTTVTERFGDAEDAPVELEAATAAVPGPVAHEWIEGTGHGFGGRDVRVVQRIAGWAPSLL